MKSNLRSFLILIIIISGCGQEAATEPINFNPPTQSPKITISPIISITQTTTSTPPSNQIILTATQQVLNARFGANCYYGSAQGIQFSPNGQWVEAICDLYSLIIISGDGKIEWDMSSASLVAPHTKHFVSLAHWSNDGGYAYIVVDPHTDGYWEPFHQGIVLYRLDLKTGHISETLPQGKSDWIFYSFAFSPNDRRLAYIVTDQSPVTLKIRDLQTGIEESFDFDPKYNTGGGFVWSPDSQQLVFSVTQFDTGAYEYIATSIILWNRDPSELTTVIKDFSGRMSVTEWADEMKINLLAEIFEPETVETRNYELNLTNNELMETNP